MDPSARRELLVRWLLAIGCFAVLIFFFSPPWGAFLTWQRVPEMGSLIETRRAASVLWQADHLGATIPDPLHGAIQWRLLFPLIGHWLNLPAFALFGLADVGCVLALAYIVTVLRRAGLGWLETGLAATILGSASWFFASVSWLGYYDSWVVLALLLVTFARSSWPVWLACCWAPWIDERFVIGAPLALWGRYLWQANADGAKQSLAQWRREFSIAAGLVAAFVLVRLGLLSGYSGSKATIAGYLGGLKIGDTPPSRFLFGVWEGWRAGWVFVVGAVLLGWRNRPRAVGLAVGVVVVALVGLGTAQDFSRSMMFIAPAAVLGVVSMAGMAAPWARWTFRAGAVAALLLPAHLVMNDAVNPIFYLYHELASLQNPPAAIMPELFELRAIQAMQGGNFDQAGADLALAIKLARDPTGPHQQRGIMLASQGHWSEAKQDFSAMVEFEPQNPDGWFLRAQAELVLGDAAASRTDMDQATSLGSEEWSRRPDVARFLTRLKASGR